MERRIGRFLFTSYTLTVFVCIWIGAQSMTITEYCTCTKRKLVTENCKKTCIANGNGKRSSLSDDSYTGGYNIFQANPYERMNDIQQCSLPQIYELLPTECSETLDMLVEWARRGLQANK
ncbi:uncharacterized protein [Asterias amurensis]|uniref:uncharacterized protein n=1 Tax=Asterias amurensis TaxID=7602 RepID=UPI003AB8C708